MSKSTYVDFRAVKAAITMEQVLEHYGLMDKFKRSGDSLSGPCPIHKGSNPTQFRVSLSKNVFNCFSECKHGGNVLDFIMKMENSSIQAAANKAVEWFRIDRAAVSTARKPDEEEDDAPREMPAPKKPAKPAPEPESSEPNKPLKFRLDKLDRNHPYLAERGLSQETVIDFGIGHCKKGVMEGRIAIPIHNPAGEVVGYIGRYPGDQLAADTPKYKFPSGFRKSQELFNIDRAVKEPVEKPLVVVEGFFDCMKLHQNGWRKVVALMGSTMSAAQEELIRKHTNPNSHIVVMLDEDDAGKAGRENIAARLSKHCFVKIHTFEAEGRQPEELNVEELKGILEGVK